MSRPFTIVLYAPEGGVQTWEFEGGRIVLGTDSECDVVLVGEGVAARHAALTFGQESMQVEDLGSAYGMLVDGARVNGAVEVWYPASVQMGEAVLSVGTERVGSLEEAGNQGLKAEKEKVITGWVPEVGEGYTLSREVARGGMSRIYEGEDPQLKRSVAVKVSRRERSAADERFFKEAEVLARLAHPNIVPVYSLGRDEGGRPAYSMKLVKGRTLQSVLDGLRDGELEMLMEFSLARLLTVFLKVCDAVAFAHSLGYLHRDLKPENVMVGEFGEVLVMDWGLATRIGEKDEVPGCAPEARTVEKSGLDSTMDGDVVGTPQYMSPEQAAGKGHVLTQRSDVYALGAILYSMLTLRPPVEGGSLDEVLRKVRDGEITPIARFERRGGGSPELEEGRGRIPNGLMAVILKAMERVEDERYQSVEELSEDIISFQGGFATNAENANLLRQLFLLVRRHQFLSITLGVLFLAGPTFTLTLIASERKARENAAMAVQQGQLALENARIAEGNAQTAQVNEKLALEGKAEARRSEAKAQIALAEAARRDLSAPTMKLALSAVPEDLRDDSWDYLSNTLDRSMFTLQAKPKAQFAGMVSHPKKAHAFFVVTDDGWVHLLDAEKGKMTDLFRVKPAANRIYRMAISSDGEKLAMALMHYDVMGPVPDRVPTIYRVKDGVKLGEFSVGGPVSKMMFSPDGSMLLVAQMSLFKTQLWDIDSGELRWEKPYKVPLASMGVFSDDGSRVYLFPTAGKMVEVDVKDGAILNSIFNAVDSEWMIRPAGGMEFFLGEKGSIRKRDPVGERILFENRPVGRGVFDVGYIPKEGRLVTATERGDGSVILQEWSGKSGLLIRSEFVPERGYLSVHALSGEIVFFRSGVLQIWRFEVSKSVRDLYASGSMLQVPGAIRFMGEPWRILRLRTIEGQGSGVASVELVDLREKTADKIPVFVGEPIRVRMVSTSQGGELFAYSTGEGAKTLVVLKREGQVMVPSSSWQVDQKITQIQISADESKVWTGGGLYELSTGRQLAKFSRGDFSSNETGVAAWVGPDKLVEMVLYSSNKMNVDSRLREYGMNRAIVLWDASSGERLVSMEAPYVVSLTVSPDGKWVLEGGRDQMIRIRSAETLEVVRQFRAHDGEVTAIGWHPKLPLIVSVSEDLSIKVWNSETCKLVEELRGFEERPETLILSPDGGSLGVFFKKQVKARFWEPVSFHPEKDNG